jgi:hypothetical protein
MRLDGDSVAEIAAQDARSTTAAVHARATGRDGGRELIPAVVKGDISTLTSPHPIAVCANRDAIDVILAGRNPHDPVVISRCKWGPNFIDFAYQHEFTLYWDAKLAGEGKHPGKKGFDVDEIPSADVHRLVAALNAHLKKVSDRTDAEDELAEQAIHAVSWTPGAVLASARNNAY